MIQLASNAKFALLVLISLRTICAQAQEIDLRRPATPPDLALKQFKLPDDLTISLVAAEPQVAQPLSITFDDRGRMWVVQYRQYPHPAGLKPVVVDQYLRTKYDQTPLPPPSGPRGADRITIFDDMTGGAVPHKQKDFVSGLNMCSGLELGYGGAFVIQPPYLLFYPDRDNDDVPDGAPEVLLNGFGLEDTHALANSLTWGPDGWLYGAQGSTVTANVRGIEFQQGIWRYHPRTKQFELFAEGGGNTWGIDFDRFGNLFAGGNTADPLIHHVQGAYYVKGFGKHGPLHNPYAYGYFSPLKHLGYQGNGLTGGFVIYGGGALPARWNGIAIYPNLRQSAMRWATLEPRGSTFQTRYGGDFIQSADLAFRPVDGFVGPDGAMYLADWYDTHISYFDPKDRTKQYEPRVNDGRIWKVTSKSGARHGFSGPPLRLRSSDELVGLLSNVNEWYSRQARLILAERRDRSVLPRLAQMIFSTPDNSQEIRLQALWAYYTIAGIDEIAGSLLAQPGEYVRAWTIRLLGDQGKLPEGLLATIVDLAKHDPSVIVRSQLACTAKRIPSQQALPLIAALVRHTDDLNDPHISLLLWWAVGDKTISARGEVLKLAVQQSTLKAPLWNDTILPRLVRRYLAERNTAGFESCAQLLALNGSDRPVVFTAMNDELAGNPLARVPAQLTPFVDRLTSHPTLTGLDLSLAMRLGARSAYDKSAALLNPKTPKGVALQPADRLEVIRAIGDAKPAGSATLLLDLLSRRPVTTEQAELFAALQKFSNDEIAVKILGLYKNLPSDLQAKAIELLSIRKVWAAALLHAIDAGQVPRSSLSIEQVRDLQQYQDGDIQALLSKHWGAIRRSTNDEVRQRVVALTKAVQSGKGNSAEGKKLFDATCRKCHRIFGDGNRIGPDLMVAERNRLDVLLPNILDPSAMIRPEFQTYVAMTQDGRVLTGVMAESSPQTITLLNADNARTVIARDNLETLKPSPVSLMPERLLDSLSEQQVRDLMAFLRSDQAPISGK